MLDNYKILTISHRTTNLKEIGDFVVRYANEAELHEQLHLLKKDFAIDELVYLSTCNRLTFLLHTQQEIDNAFIIKLFQAINPDLKEALILEKVLSYKGLAAIEHVYQLAASIDSLVVGEREILRQFREAFNNCQAWGLTGDNLRLLARLVVEGAKEVYAQTRIGEKPVSIVSLAIKNLLNSNLKKDARILLVGAGQTNNLVAKFLVKYQYTNVTVFNRTLAKAEKLAKYLNGKSQRLVDLAKFTEGFDCMVVCTGATEAVIDSENYRELLNGETDKKLVIDLSIPNNVAKAVRDNFNLKYIEIEDLRQAAKVNLAFREKEVTIAKELLKDHILAFPGLYQQRQIARAMRHVPDQIKAIKSHAMNSVFRKEVESLDGDTRELLERMMAYMEKRCIGIPMKAAKDAMV
ncbi:MAG: glutamyl-tRNA reductase [Saprospiraceae bacterium]